MIHTKPPTLLAGAALILSLVVQAQASAPLWQIGAADGKNDEFALAPSHYSDFRADALFVVGRSVPKQDWPYVQPGPVDAWAGARQHTFTVLFGLKTLPAAGDCKLTLRLLDAHNHAPPELRISLNGHAQQFKVPPGAGDHTINGQPGPFKPHTLQAVFPSSALKPAANELGITTLSGCWVLYDNLEFETPEGAQLGDITGSTVSSVSSPPVLVQRDGKLMQLVRATIRNFGEKTDALLRVAGAPPQALTLESTSQEAEVAIPAVEKPVECPMTLEVGGKVVATASVKVGPVRKWTVFLLPHSHVDIGYTHVQTDVERAQWRYLELGIDTARRSATNPPGSQFKWNVEVLWAVDSYLKQASPEKQREFIDAVKAGWVGLDALYGNELTGLCREEELLRLLGVGVKLSQRTGVPIESAMITDVPGYSWGIVPAFAQTGVKYFSMGPNGGDRIGHTIAAWGDKPFWWIGPNGRDKVLVWMTGTGYYQVFRSPDLLQNYLAGLETKGYPYDMVQVRHCLGDNGAPDVNFPETVRKWNATYAYPRLVIATTAEMFRAFEQRYGKDLPTAKGDFTPYWEDGAASSARETALNRASADRLLQAQALFAMLNPAAYPADAFSEAWRDVVLYDEHTWGAHNSISQPDAPFVKSQWAIKQAFALEGAQKSQKLFQSALALRPGPSTPTPVATFDVLNTASAPRTDLVTLPASWTLAGDRVRTGNKDVPSQRLGSGELVFVANSVPAFGSRRYTLSPEPSGASAGSRAARNGKKAGAPGNPPTLENSAIRLKLDPNTGGIASLLWKPLRAELVDAKAPTAINDYFYLPGTDLKNLQRNGPVKVTLKESGPVLTSLLVSSEAPGCVALTREIRLIEGLDRVDLINLVDKKAVRAKEGVHFGFGFNVPDGTVRLDVPWATVRPELDQIPGACKNWLTVQRWLDISNDRFGVTLATPDSPLFEIGGITANLVGSLSDPGKWLTHLPPSRTVYAWAMNNHWHTNYRAEQDGVTTFRYSIWLHKAFHAEAAIQAAASWNQPLLPAPVSASSSTPAPNSLFTVSNPGVVVTDLKPSEDAKAIIIRLFAASGKPERAQLAWPLKTRPQVWLSNATEQPLSRLDGPLDLPPFGVATLRVELP